MAELSFGQVTAHASSTDKMRCVQTGQKKKDCQTLPRQDKMVLKTEMLLLNNEHSQKDKKAAYKMGKDLHQTND